jgi:sporulation protein YlmC with PRC-barrel domain
MQQPILSQGARLTAVKLKNTSGQEIGKVIEWMMDVKEGRVVYVVVELYGNEAYLAVPWSMMKADLERGGYKLDVDKIKSASVEIDRGQINNLVNDKEILTKLQYAYGQQQQDKSDGRIPSGPSSARDRADIKSSGQSNAEVGEGKGYGG